MNAGEPAPPPDRGRDLRARLIEATPALVYLLLPALLVLPKLGSGRFLFGHDLTLIFYYTCGAVGNAFAEGRLPVWDPHQMCGLPLLAGMQWGILYPPTWLAAVLRPGAFWTISVALHLSLAGLFADRWLVRGLSLGRWAAMAGAAAFMLSGFGISHVFGGHLSLVCTIPWAPAVLWRLERFLAAPSLKRAALLSVVFLLLVLAGHPQTALIACVAVGARLVHFAAAPAEGRKARLRLALAAAGALLAGGLLAAPQLLPTAELTGHTQRVERDSYAFSTTYSLPPESLVTLFAPTFFGDATTVPYWGRWLIWDLTGFAGIASLALAVLGAAGRRPQALFWAAMAAIGLLLAMGSHTPLFKAYFHLMPGASLFRSPARYLFLFTLSLAPLIGRGFERLWTGDERAVRHATRLAAAAGALIVIAAVAWMSLRSPERWTSVLKSEAEAARGEREEIYLAGPVFENGSREMALNSLGIAGVTLAAVAAALLAGLRFPLRWTAGGLAVILAAELIVFDLRYLVDHPEKEMEWPASFVENVRTHPQAPFRIATLTPDPVDAAGKCRLAGLDHVGGYDPMMLRRYLSVARAAAGIADDSYAVASVPSRPGPINDLLGVRYWIVPGPKQTPPGWNDVGQMGANFIYENPGALPRAFLVGRSMVLPSDAERLKALARRDFNPRDVVVLESGDGGGTDGPAGAVTIVSRAPGSYDLRADCAADAWLVLTESDYPGWSAEVDGAPAPIFRADYFVQSVHLTRGAHKVRFTYRSRSLRTGFAVAGATLLLSTIAGLILRRRTLA